jgi:hypothetical protein
MMENPQWLGSNGQMQFEWLGSNDQMQFEIFYM